MGWRELLKKAWEVDPVLHQVLVWVKESGGEVREGEIYLPLRMILPLELTWRLLRHLDAYRGEIRRLLRGDAGEGEAGAGDKAAEVHVVLD